MAVLVARGKNKLDLDCRRCTEEDRIEYGCEKDSPIEDMWSNPDFDLAFRRCPLKIIKRESWEFIDAYNFYKDKILPVSGGIDEQTCRYKEAMMIIGNTINKIRQREIEELKQ